MPELSIIVVSYNTRDMTLACLRSVYAETNRTSFELIVVDNASHDGSAEAIAEEFGGRIELVRSKENIGFAAANNLAAQRAQGTWLLLLNPDTVVLDGAIEKLLTFAQSKPQAGICGGRTVFADGRLNIASCWRAMTPWSLFCSAAGLTAAFPRSHWFDPEAFGSWQRDSEREVDIVVGCFLMIPTVLWHELNGFDLKYWMYGEEADLCLRARRLGYRPMITPTAEIIHYVGAATGTSARKTPLVAKAKATLIRDHWSAGTRWWGLGMLWCWAAMRLVGASLLVKLKPEKFRAANETWRAIWQQRHDWLGGYRTEAPGSQTKSLSLP